MRVCRVRKFRAAQSVTPPVLQTKFPLDGLKKAGLVLSHFSPRTAISTGQFFAFSPH